MAEKIVGASQSVTWNSYIMLGGEMVALKVTGAVPQTRYFHKDHLGSIVALTDESGAVVERDSFDAWGQRRSPLGEDDPLYPGQSITSQITRGYTGHEQLDTVGLVHMNGRIYEPVIGKMMSPDPTVPDPFDGQAYNRYAYVLNNPLSLTDPTGFRPDLEQRDKHGQASIGGNGRESVGSRRDTGTKTSGGGDTTNGGDRLSIQTASSEMPDPMDLFDIFHQWFERNRVIQTIEDPIERAVADTRNRADALARVNDYHLQSARYVRDEKIKELRTQGLRPGAVVAGWDPRTGQVAVGVSSCAGCAEDDVAKKLGIPKDKVKFTEAVQPRTLRSVPVCMRCESKYPRENFEQGTKFKSDEMGKMIKDYVRRRGGIF
jgi:RHS repeat-associated protein